MLGEAQLPLKTVNMAEITRIQWIIRAAYADDSAKDR